MVRVSHLRRASSVAWLYAIASFAFAAHSQAAAPSVGVRADPSLGTVVLLHGGGWTGPDPYQQKRLLDGLGRQFASLGWTAISLDYDRGRDGLSSVLRQLRPLARSKRRLCVYAESAGGHLALLAAARLPRLRCVVTLGAPTDLRTLTKPGAPPAAFVADELARRAFGASDRALRRWSPVRRATRIRGCVLLMLQADDQLIDRGQSRRFLASNPAAQSITLARGRGAGSPDAYLHGSLSTTGRRQLVDDALGHMRRATRTRGKCPPAHRAVVTERKQARSVEARAEPPKSSMLQYWVSRIIDAIRASR